MSILEVWKIVPGWYLYAISSLGRVRRRDGGILKPTPNKDGYLMVDLRDCHRRRHVKVASLVCESFHGPRPPGKEVRHINGIRTDDVAKNLCWGTHQENMDDREKHGNTLKGEKAPSAKLSDEEAIELREKYQALKEERRKLGFKNLTRGMKAKLCIQYNLSPGCLSKVGRGLSYKDSKNV